MAPDWREANPTYWLEIRQTRRNYLFFAALVGGILAGAYLFLIVFDPTEHLWWDEFPLLAFPLGIYALGTLSIPLYSGVKLASQQVNEDLSLKTPLRGRAILWGKLQVAMTLSVCLFAPSMPGALVLACFGNPNWLLLCAAGPILTVFTTMISLGFMSGAKTPLMRGGMIFLSFIFGLGNVPILIVLAGCLIALFDPSAGIETWGAAFGLAFGITILGLSAIFVFSLGLAMIQLNRNLVHVLIGIGVLVVLLVPIPLLVLFLSEPPWSTVLGFLLLGAAYFTPPTLAVRYVKRYYENRSPLLKR